MARTVADYLIDLKAAFDDSASPAELARAAGDIPADVADQVRSASTPGAALHALLSSDKQIVELQAELESRVMTIDEGDEARLPRWRPRGLGRVG